MLRPLQAITNAPPEYDYGWMHTVVDHIGEDSKGRLWRLVENEDDWHFQNQLQRYGSGLYQSLTTEAQINDFVAAGLLKWTTSKAVPYHRIKVNMEQAMDWDREARLNFLTNFLNSLKEGSPTTYTTGHDMTYYFTSRGDNAFEELKNRLQEFGLQWTFCGPRP